MAADEIRKKQVGSGGNNGGGRGGDLNVQEHETGAEAVQRGGGAKKVLRERERESKRKGVQGGKERAGD